MDFYIGMVMPWSISRVPTEWKICDGQTLEINQYQALYSLIGNTYGGDQSKGTFCLPDLRGRFPIGAYNNNIGTKFGSQAEGAMPSIDYSKLPLIAHTHTISNTIAPAGGIDVKVPVNLDIAIPVNTDAYPSPMPTPATYTNSPTGNNCTLATGKTGNNATTTNIYTTNNSTTNATLKPFNVQKDINVKVPLPAVTSTCSSAGTSTGTGQINGALNISSIALNYIICVNGLYPES